MPERYDLDEVIQRVQAGDRDLYVHVIEKCHVKVRAIISSLVRDRDDADDLAQRTFIFAYKHLSDYSPETNFLAWLKAIARTMVMDHHKRSRTRRVALKRYINAEIARRASEISGLDSADHRVELLEHCIEDLSDAQRSFLSRAHGRGSTLDKLARELGRTGAAIRKQLSRLHGLLRTCIERQSGTGEASV